MCCYVRFVWCSCLTAIRVIGCCFLCVQLVFKGVSVSRCIDFAGIFVVLCVFILSVRLPRFTLSTLSTFLRCVTACAACSVYICSPLSLSLLSLLSMCQYSVSLLLLIPCHLVRPDLFFFIYSSSHQLDLHSLHAPPPTLP